MRTRSRWLLLVLLLAAPASVAGQEAPSFVNEGIVDAPVADVWKVWTTSEGYRLVGVALADVDFRIGGLIRSRYSASGTLGDAETIQNRILAYEPMRMIAMRIDKPPASFPFKEAWKNTWTVVTLTPLSDGRTHVRAASMGFGSDQESVAMRRFFERGNDETLKTLVGHFAKLNGR
jgi:uncharacterized protein YndB with AHSA1/START domain